MAHYDDLNEPLSESEIEEELDNLKYEISRLKIEVEKLESDLEFPLSTVSRLTIQQEIRKLEYRIKSEQEKIWFIEHKVALGENIYRYQYKRG